MNAFTTVSEFEAAFEARRFNPEAINNLLDEQKRASDEEGGLFQNAQGLVKTWDNWSAEELENIEAVRFNRLMMDFVVAE